MDAVLKMWWEPPVQDLGFAARAVVHTGIWTAWLLLLQLIITAQMAILQKVYLLRSTKSPAHSWQRMWAESLLGYLGWTWPLGLVSAWINPGQGGFSWSYSCPNLLLVGYYAAACTVLYDLYAFPLHKWMHENKLVLRFTHKKHHDMHAVIDVTTSGYMALTEGCLTCGLPMVMLYLLGVNTGNWWYMQAGMYHCFHILLIGHCGADISMNDWKDLFVLLSNPMLLWFLMCPVHSTPQHHADHHLHPRTNFAFFYTYMDDLYNSNVPAKPPCSLLVITAHAVWQLLLLSTAYAFITHPLAALAVYVACYLLVPSAAAAAVSEWVRLPAITRRLFGRLMDKYRADSCITCADIGPLQGSTGASQVLEGPTGTDTHNRDQDAPKFIKGVKDNSTKAPVYLFACHPAGLLSRAAFCTFAARGSCLSALHEVRLAVGDPLFSLPIPFLREFLLACGCIPADQNSICSALHAGRSVAVTPGGWREARYHGTYKLLLRQRKGFVRLAQKTGAVLVPVLCIGEQDVARMPTTSPLMWAYRFLQVFRPHPVHVVFGQPIVPEPGQSLEKLHQCYMSALVELGRQHDVQLEVAE